ncbi:DUF6779 domain-containing protein [Aldersonia kunmingensis]|uniref:DUF6779 domain-containing protein n=1 Tax=Aldersonia kunmingensis TaxID=408066 RepID=UPI00082B9E2F|nr:DUF6779 domain-containing protein [Aldersonia kunmingensis]
MTSSARTGSARRSRRGRSQLLPGALILLGLVATGFLVFSDSVELLRLGLMAAVWAAVIAVFAMTRYRRESALDKSKAEDLQTVYRLQLEREVSARREYELGVETKLRREVSAEAEELAALREELAALRRNLEFLFDGDLPAERVALRAERIAELTVSDSPTRHSDDAPAPQTPVYGVHEAEAPRFASPADAPVTAEVAAIEFYEVEEERAWSAWSAGSSTDVAAAADEHDEPTLPEVPVSRRRRRAVDNDDLGTGTTGLSVAQIMANLAAEKSAVDHDNE